MASDEPSGFSFETFDVTAARVSQSHIASRLTAGPKDESGRFRVTKGMSSLSAAEDVSRKKDGVTLMDPTKAISCNVVKRFAEAPVAGGVNGRDSKRSKTAADEEKGERSSDAKTKKKNDKNGGGRPCSWLSTGLVVKILAKSLKEAGHYKKKGVVRRVSAPHKAEVEIVGSDPAALVEVDERDLETVLPAPGKPVRVVKGDHAGSTGELRAVHEKRFLAEVAVDAADGVRQRVEFLQYDEVCKVHAGGTRAVQ